MSVRRLHHEQPSGFVFSRENAAWARKTIAKYPKGRQASAVIPLLWRGQEQEGWVSEPMIRAIADMLGMPYIRVLEVATFYTMFQLQPVGRKAHIQVCGTTPCMLRGAEELKAVCQRRIHPEPHHLSADGAFSWEEVECLGACVNAPMIQIVKDTYEDLTPETLEKLIDDIAAGRPVKPGPQNGRQHAAPLGGPTTLLERVKPARVARAKAPAAARPAAVKAAPAAAEEGRPAGLDKARGGKPDDLKLISGVGPKIEGILHGLGIFHFDQVAGWNEAEREWVDGYLKFRGRIEREDWVSQAKILAKGGETAFSRRAAKGAAQAPAKPRGKGD